MPAIGIGAPVMLTALRFIQGVGVGGEWGGSVLLSMEWARANRRGFIAQLAAVRRALGPVPRQPLPCSHGARPGTIFPAWGWRIPFVLSIILVALGLYIRLGVLETPAFSRGPRTASCARPLREVLREHPAEILLSAFAGWPSRRRSTSSPPSCSPTRRRADTSRDSARRPARGGDRVGHVPLFGHLSDRFGREDVHARRRPPPALRVRLLRRCSTRQVLAGSSSRSCCRSSRTP